MLIEKSRTPMTPVYHWTDQKVRVHAFCCVVSLLLVSLLHHKLRQHQLDISLEQARQLLRELREITWVYGDGEPPPKALSQRSSMQQQLFEILDLQAFAPAVG